MAAHAWKSKTSRSSAIRPSVKRNVDLTRLLDRPAVRAERVARQPRRAAVVLVRGERAHLHGEVLRAAGEHAPHRAHLGTVQARVHRVGEVRVRGVAGRHRRAVAAAEAVVEPLERRAAARHQATWTVQLGAGGRADVVDADAGRGLAQDEAVVGDVEDGEVGDDPVDARRGRCSGSVHSSTILCVPSLATCSIITMTRLAPCTRSIAPPMPLTILPGIIQLARSPVAGHLHRAEDRDVDVAAADHRRSCVAESKKRAPGQHGDGLLAGVDQVGVHLVLGRVRPDAEDARSRDCSTTSTSVGHVVRDQRRQADAEVDVLRRRCSSRATRAASCSRVSAISRASRCRTVASLDALLGRLLGGRARRRAARRCPGVWTWSGSSSPGSTSSSTSAMVTRPAIAHERVEVARGLVEDEVAVPVALRTPAPARSRCRSPPRARSRAPSNIAGLLRRRGDRDRRRPAA